MVLDPITCIGVIGICLKYDACETINSEPYHFLFSVFKVQFNLKASDYIYQNSRPYGFFLCVCICFYSVVLLLQCLF